MTYHYFEARCNAPACDEKFMALDDKQVEEALDKHFAKFHPERYHTKMDLPFITFVRVPDSVFKRMFPKSFEQAFQESMK